MVLTKGDVTGGDPVLVRMHALNPLEDVLGIGPTGRRRTATRDGDHRRRGPRRGVPVLRDAADEADAAEDDDAPAHHRQTGLGAQILPRSGCTQLEPADRQSPTPQDRRARRLRPDHRRHPPDQRRRRMMAESESDDGLPRPEFDEPVEAADRGGAVLPATSPTTCCAGARAEIEAGGRHLEIWSRCPARWSCRQPSAWPAGCAISTATSRLAA
ncbi:MAG: hypothetical protein U5K36_01570 [Roseovarius sp.]|nr:hypothetical protein [Roseovarius sp.]